MMSEELIRDVLKRIKKIENLRIPNYELPSESHLEELAIDIILMVHNYIWGFVNNETKNYLE